VCNGIAVELGELVDVLALIAALGRVLAAAACLDRLAEEVDLPPGVVEVVLPLDLVARIGEHARDGVAVRAVARGADGQRAGRVRRDELDLDLLRIRRGAAAVVRPDLRERLPEPGSRHPEVDEAGAGHFRALDLVVLGRPLGQLGGELLRRSPVLRGALERDVRRVVAVSRILRPLQLDGRVRQL
jgi:hypothetical protein